MVKIMKNRYILRLVKEFNDRKNKVYLVTGFHGYGDVGFLTTRYLVYKLGMELVGYIETPSVPDITSFEDYGFSLPHEIFYKNLDDEKSLVVLLNRLNPERKYISSFVKEFLSLIKKLNITEILLVGGLDSRFREGDEEYRWLKTQACTQTLNAPYFTKGFYIVGPLASLLITLHQNNVPALIILPYTQPETIDHRAAAVAINVISSIIGIEIDVKELLNYAAKAEELEKAVQELYEQQLKRRESVMHT
jgi:uncharacterized protein